MRSGLPSPLVVLLGMVSWACSSPTPPAPAPASAAVASSTPAVIQNPPELAERVPAQWLASGGQPRAVLVHGGYAYVADLTGLSVYAVGPEGQLSARHHVPTPGEAQDVTLSGGRLYVADGRAGVACFSLDSPEHPRLLETHALPGAVRRVRGSEHGVAALQEGGFLTLLRPGLAPEHLHLPGEPRDAAWVGEHLYVADTGDGLLGVEVTTGPLRVSWRERTWRWAISLAAHGSRLLLGTHDKRVILLDTSGSVPRPLTEVALAYSPVRLDALESSVLASGGETGGAGADLLDLSGGDSLRPGARLPSPTLAAASLSPSLLLAARGALGLEVLEATPSLSVHARVPGLRLERLTVGSKHVVAWAEGSQATRAWRLGPGSAQPQELPSVRWRQALPCGETWCVVDEGGQLCRQQLPWKTSAPRTCATLADPLTTAAWQPSTDTLWLHHPNGGLSGWASTPSWRHKTDVGVPQPLQFLMSLTVQGRRGVAVDPALGLLHVFELGAAPSHLSSFLLQARPERVTLSGDMALVAEPQAGLQVVDVTDPKRPRERAWVPREPGPWDVAVWRPAGTQAPGWVALAEGEAGVSLWMWNGSDQLRLLHHLDTPGRASSVAFVEGALWVADGTGVVRYPLVGAPR